MVVINEAKPAAWMYPIKLLFLIKRSKNLIAATDNGIYKSINAGANWSVVKNGGDFKAMVLKPYSKDTVYAVLPLRFGDL